MEVKPLGAWDPEKATNKGKIRIQKKDRALFFSILEAFAKTLMLSDSAYPLNRYKYQLHGSDFSPVVQQACQWNDPNLFIK